MASMIQCRLGASMSLRKRLEKSSLLVQKLNNERHLRNLVVTNTISIPTLHQLQVASKEQSAVAEVKIKENLWRVWCSSSGESGTGHQAGIDGSSQSTVEKKTNEFFLAFASETPETWDKLLSDDCTVEYHILDIPYRGKKEMKELCGKMRDAMGSNISFHVDKVMAGKDEYTATVNWYLEWKQKRIASGASVFQYKQVSGEHFIWKITILGPDKPGHLTANILKVASALFDRFPQEAEEFLS